MTRYEFDIRVPLLVRGPGVRRNLTLDLLAGNIDLASTFLDIANAPPLGDGKSLLPALLSKPYEPWRTEFLVEYESVTNW